MRVRLPSARRAVGRARAVLTAPIGTRSMGSNGQQRGYGGWRRSCDERAACPESRLFVGLPRRCPRQESNLDLPLRRRSSYPLDYEGSHIASERRLAGETRRRASARLPSIRASLVRGHVGLAPGGHRRRRRLIPRRPAASAPLREPRPPTRRRQAWSATLASEGPAKRWVIHSGVVSAPMPR